MGNSIVKNTIGTLVLIILSFIIGIIAADDIKSSMMLIFALAGCGVLVMMGKRVRYALFLLVPICEGFPRVANIPLEYPLEAAVLCYWVLLSFIGHAKLTWRKLPGVDLFVLLLVTLMFIAYIRYPVSIEMLESLFGFKAEYTRGKAYIYMIFFLINYICISCIPFEKDELYKLLKWNLIILLGSSFFEGINSIILSGYLPTGEARFTGFQRFGTYLFIVAYCSVPAIKILSSPLLIFSIITSSICILITGYRTFLMMFFANILTCILVKKEYIIFFVSAIIGLSFLLFLGISGTLNELPYTFQRVLSGIPGLEVSRKIKGETNSSTEWRVVMWKWALDPRMGYIKDYIFGDGIGFKKSDITKYRRAGYKAETPISGITQQRAFAAQRMWHSGVIESIQCLGFVGLFTICVLLLYATIVMYRVNSALRKTPYFVYSMVHTCTIPATILSYFVAAGTLEALFLDLATLPYIKFFHRIAIEEGKLSSHCGRQKYIPKLIQEGSNH